MSKYTSIITRYALSSDKIEGPKNHCNSGKDANNALSRNTQAEEFYFKLGRFAHDSSPF